jgi:CRP-like cAMP-binding protein
MSYHSQQEMRPANRVLAGLPFDTWQRISPHLQRCLIFSGQILHETDEPAARFYFPNSGLISIVQKTGASQLEVAMAGRETFIGALNLLQSDGVSPLRAVAQTPGTAFWLPQSVMREEWERDSRMRQLVLTHANWLMRQTAQSALCCCAHNVEERLSRWLLSARDRLDSEEICVTHQSIAQMLGVRRSGVTMTLRAFQQKELLRTARGRILLENRDGLERLACSCRANLQPILQELSAGEIDG